MKTLTLHVSDEISDQFLWLLKHFSPDEIAIVDIQAHFSDDDYLRSINGMTESLHKAKAEPNDKGVSLQELDW